MHAKFIMGGVIATLLTAASADAQFSQQQRNLRYGAPNRSTTSAILSRPTVSPYLALTDLTGTGLVDNSTNYFTVVRPRMEREAQQRRQQIQLQNIQQNVSAMRSAAARQSQSGGRATGHPTRFGFYLQYYPTLNRRF